MAQHRLSHNIVSREKTSFVCVLSKAVNIGARRNRNG